MPGIAPEPEPVTGRREGGRQGGTEGPHTLAHERDAIYILKSKICARMCVMMQYG